jgi:hypothetical protein
MLEPRKMDKNEFASFLANGEPDTLEYFKASVEEGFSNSLPGVALDYVKETFAAAPEERASREQGQENINAFYEKRAPKIVDRDSPQLPKPFTLEDWKNSPHYREGIEFKEGWSEERAKYLADGFDDRKEREFILQRGRESSNTLYGSGVVGQIIGSLPDPINLIPFGGAASRGARIGEKIARASFEGAVGNLAVSGVTRPYWDSRGTESTWHDYANDLWMGAGMGAMFGLAGHGVSKIRERRANVTMKERAPVAKAADMAVESQLRGEDFDPAQVPGLKEAHDSIFDVDGVKHSDRVVMVEQELIDLGLDADTARESIAPLMAHVRMMADATGKTFDEAFDEFGATFQAADFNGKDIIPVAPEVRKAEAFIDSEIMGMAEELNFAEKGGVRIFNEGEFKGTTGEGSFPSWYKDLGVKNREQFFKALESKKGKTYEKIKALAEKRLLEGYESKTAGRMEPSREFMELKQGMSEPLFQAAYHGSPHKFDKFSTEHIGSGEGNQGFGWGLYFTSSKDVAEYYRTGLKVDGTTGQTYKVDIPDEHQFLSRDSLLKDQPEAIQKGVRAAFEELVSDPTVKQRMPGYRNFVPEFGKKEWDDALNGQGVYDFIQTLTGSDKEASLLLKKHGVEGVKYKGERDFTNFVVFDDSRIKIEETFYKKSETIERGAITFREQGRAVVSLFKSADRSTILHETGHLFLNNLERLSKMEGVDPRFKADLDRAYNFLGVKPGEKIQRVHHEKFAEGFEQFLREGRSPRRELDGVFTRFKDWLTDIYRSIKDFDTLKAEITDDARELYSNLLGGDVNRLKEIPTTPEVRAPEVRAEAPEYSVPELEELAGQTPGLITPEEMSGFKSVMSEIEAEEKAIDEALTFFQGAKTADDLEAAARAAGVSKTKMQEIIDAFNEKLLKEANARMVADDMKKALAIEAAELKRQAFLAGESRARNISHVQTVIKSGGSAKQSVLSLLEGDSTLRGVEGAGNSVDGAYTALAQSTSSKTFSELRKVDPRIERLFEDDIQFNQNVAKEMMKPGSSGDDIAAKAAKILSDTLEELRQRDNLAGGKIGKLDEGYFPRTHEVEKMIGKEAEWVAFMEQNLDRERSFTGLDDKEFKQALKDTFRSLLTGEHGNKPEIDTAIPTRRPPRNIAKKFGESRTLHFKGPEVEVAYLKQFGQGENVLQSVASRIENMSRNIALMERLGPNPESTVAYLIDKLRKDIDEKVILGDLDDKATVKMLDDLGTAQSMIGRDSEIGHAMMQALGEVSTTQGWFKNASRIIRSVNSLSKLGSALLSQPTDFVHAVNERRLLSDNNVAKLWVETFKDYFSSPDPKLKEVLDHVGLFVDAINYKNFNRFDGDNINLKLARANDWMFRWSGQNWHVKHSKQAAGLSLAREVGANISKSWAEISPGLREMLTQYGSFNEQKWDMLKLAKPLEVDGKAYYHPGMINEIPDSAFKVDSKLEGKALEDAIKRERFKLEMDLKTFFVEESRNAAPEPDAKIRRKMAFGTKTGTNTNEAIKLLTQFKTFAFVNWDRSIKGKRMMKDGRDYGGLAHHAAATLMLGYISTVLKDLAKGQTPADPEKPGTWGRAAAQSGGLGIMGDFFGSAYSARSGSDVLATLAGPTLSTISGASVLALKAAHGETYEDGSKYASKWIDQARSIAPAPFSTLWYTRAAMDFLIWSQLKETLDPGSIARSERRLRKEYNQKYLMSPRSIR